MRCNLGFHPPAFYFLNSLFLSFLFSFFFFQTLNIHLMSEQHKGIAYPVIAPNRGSGRSPEFFSKAFLDSCVIIVCSWCEI